MNQKPSPLSKLTGITPEQAEELLEVLRPGAYRVGVAWVKKNLGLTVSISGLRRWWARETKARSRADLRSAIKASEQFDRDLDARALDERANNALRAAFWQAVTSGDREAVKTFATLSLDYNADSRDTEKLQRLLKAEAECAALRAEVAEANGKIADLLRQLAEAGKTSIADPAAVSAELDRHLGVRK